MKKNIMAIVLLMGMVLLMGVATDAMFDHEMKTEAEEIRQEFSATHDYVEVETTKEGFGKYTIIATRKKVGYPTYEVRMSYDKLGIWR